MTINVIILVGFPLFLLPLLPAVAADVYLMDVLLYAGRLMYRCLMSLSLQRSSNVCILLTYTLRLSCSQYLCSVAGVHTYSLDISLCVALLTCALVAL